MNQPSLEPDVTPAAASNVADAPRMRVTPPGPQSRQWHARCEPLPPPAGRTSLMPVTFASGRGCVLVDVDGNQYLDFSSGIYVTTLGHCHPKVTEAVQRAAGTLQNVHRYATPIKAQLKERLADRLPGDFSGFQFFDSGTTAVEAALRVAREATGRQELISAYNDYHGKTYAASGLSQVDARHAGPIRAPGCHLVPRPDRYRPHWTRADGGIDTDRYLQFYDEYLRRATVQDTAAFVLEPIQGWAGTVMPPDDFFPKLRRYCDQSGLLLVTDEILTGMGRTGKWLCTEHWEVIPDVVTLGKGLGNGFPISCVAVRELY
ncbi:MAG: aminotransferase class III-fold pyridoxal phosphate-dependent enzyme, partial [Planctomycetota bacterium]